MATTARVMDLLDLGEIGAPGHRRLLREEDALIRHVRSGLPYASLEAVASRLGLGPTELGRVLRLPFRTLARRKTSRRLSADESDRLVRAARIVALGEETLGGPLRLGHWLRAPNAALGNTPPIDWLDTDVGTKEIEELLLRVSHGVHS